MDRLITYVSAPLDTACLALVATKLDGRRKLASMARSGGFLVSCEPIKRAALPRFIEHEAKQRGHAIPYEVADVLAEIAGPELGAVLDAIERLSLYVGEHQPIAENDVAMCVTRIRPSSIWSLVGAVAERDAATALRVLGDVYEPQDRGLRLVGVLAWSTRQLLRFAVAFKGGASPEQAAKAAGAPPFKARELAAQVRKLRIEEIEHWLRVLADTDLALKGSRRPSRAVLESAILTMTMGLPR
jgi:DNA polymerase-3 subunit delta